MLTDKQKKLLFERFGRCFFVLFSRATMYTINHPITVQALDDLQKALIKILEQADPLVFIMNREQFFIEDEIFDPKINTERMVTHFKKAKIESISFEKGIKTLELTRFLHIFINIQKYPSANQHAPKRPTLPHDLLLRKPRANNAVSPPRILAMTWMTALS